MIFRGFFSQIFYSFMFKVISSENISFQSYQNKNVWYIRVWYHEQNQNSADVRRFTI